MKPNFHIQKELETLHCTVLANGVAMPYTVDDSYFEKFGNGILLQIHLEQTHKTSTFSVPNGYFEQLPKQLLQLVKYDDKLQELSDVAPILSSIKKAMPYTVPNAYFENNFPTTLAQTKPAKLVLLHKKGWVKWATAAAMIIGIISTIMVVNKPSKQFETLASKPVLEQISDEEIQNYLTHNDVVHSLASQAANEANNNEKDNSFDLLSDEEIQQYLQENQQAEKNIKSL